MANQCEKNIFFLICFFMSFSLCAGELVLLLMIKNEADVIEKTLQPFVDAGVTRFVVLDTGSTDNTVEIVQNFFERYQLDQAYLVQEPFVDFATSRNVAINWAEQLFQDDCFLFMIDAEWYVYGIEGLIQFCYEHNRDPDTSFLVLIKHGMNYYTQWLFRAHRGVRFVGVAHEDLNVRGYQKVPDTTYIVHAPSQDGLQKSRNRWLLDAQLLLKELEKNPNCPRTLFYLAQSYHCLGDWENACIWYEKRCQIKGWDEENFVSRYRLARVYEAMENWDEALKTYLEAYSMRPSRIEPLIHLARYCAKENKFALAYMFAYSACQSAFPQEDVLFVETDLYEYDRYNVLGCVAWYVGKYDIGKWAVEKALISKPNYEHLYNNLSLYNEKLLH